MAFFKIFNKPQLNTELLKDTLTKVKNGDTPAKEKLIDDYRPFIIKVVCKTVGKYIDIKKSEEYSIGLIAFNEAVECYNAEKNPNFLNFAEKVIKRRVIDYLRSSSKNRKTFPFINNYNDNPFEERYLKVDEGSHFENIETKEEISILAKKLQECGITLQDLVNNAPKHMDSKRLAIRIARVLSENNSLYEKLERKKSIPMVELLKLVDVNPKTIERHRKFIIAVCFIINSNLDVLQSYVKNVEKGGSAHA